jgi:sigma-B regulation protein RsbU (phosphoserine phosphatase)
MPIGILPKVHYEHGEVVLDRGDRLVLYTDGLSESRRQGTDVLFDEFLPQAASGPAVSPEELLNRIVLAERRHRGTGPQLDDLTILVGGFE